mgnify:FL=1|tara:strand:- start:191 stop:1033 length:843 start_codon:yes stop_codon:yes gene_type:complete
MSNLTDLISAGGGGTLFTIPVTKSTTWTPPFDGTAVIHVIGAGGSGATSQANELAGGGAAGGYSRKVVTLSTGTNWTMVVGASGAPEYGQGYGNAGGNSSATDGSSTLTANGGGGGLNGSSTPAAGGTASGGDVNNSGGAGGGGSLAAGTGGAVGILGTGNAGTNHDVGNNDVSNSVYGGHSDVISPQFENTNGELRGGGTGGRSYLSSSFNYGTRGNGGFLAGGGAAHSSQSRQIQGGDGGIGAGGGSCVISTSPTYLGITTSGAGGHGLIIVMYTAIG